MFEVLIETFQYDYAWRALTASAMVGVMCGILGCFIVLKNMSLIGDALSHAILPGVVVGFLVAGYSVLGFFTGSVIAGITAAVLITWIQRNVRTQEDAAIGIVFTSMFALGVMGISWLTRQEGVHLDLKDFLFGNILGIADQDLWLTFMVMCFTIICVLAFYRYFFVTTFESVVAETLGISVSTMHYFLMLLLSFAVVASLQSVGVILVVAMLITPASTAYLLTYELKKMVFLAAIIGLVSTTLGMLLAIIFETTPGPAMTVTATTIYGLAVFFSPQRGIVSRFLKRRKKQQRILQEDVLKQSVRLHEKQDLGLNSLSKRLGLEMRILKRQIHKLQTKGLMQIQGQAIILTDQGIKMGYNLIRAHRLWETYLVKELGLNEDQIHEDAERYEHILPEDLVEEVAEHLGYPQTDPHGSPIPNNVAYVKRVLSVMKPGHALKISQNQVNHLVRSELWERGIAPGSQVEMLRVKADHVEVRIDDKMLSLPKTLADRILIE
jgi:ABC-type Mn2+/Zn2+ transport system permease subunit/Mn-dependent DtxR family transcriptional regulator